MPAVAGIIAVEGAVVLCQAPARRARMLPTVLAGFGVALAWLASLWGFSGAIVASALLVSLVAHAFDVRGRW